ncbi:MAG: alkaline shock response membrane anchor protein AmaP [Victivallaceae bacterium]|nr:alkaline shock response membrane anchor protein AmaP [Victivallaceae bacterium]
MLEILIKGIFDRLHIVTNDFNLGFFAGVGFALLLIIILLTVEIIIMIIFRKKKCSGITISEADGETFVSKSAISSLIMHLEKDFPLISIKKLLLYRCRKNHILKLYIDFNDDGSGLPPQSKKLKSEIRSLLNHTFGIDSIKKIIIDVKNATLEKKKPATPEVKLNIEKVSARPAPVAPAEKAEKDTDKV